MNILVTGGAGYIGSHTIIELIELGYTNIVSIDNYINSDESNYKRIEEITGTTINYIKVDLIDTDELDSIFKKTSFDAVIHFAALKSVPESVDHPNKYYKNNLTGLLNLLDVMKNNNVNQLIFSSSCSVYGNPDNLPVNESTPFGTAESPYARSKQIGENIIEDFCKVNHSFNAISLRYFNPVGAHKSGKIGEGFTKRPNNLLPIITQTAAKLREKMIVFGNDYNTNDGSCVRDYIHVSDIANAHVKALTKNDSGYQVVNLGTGNGTSVFEMITCFERVTKVSLHYEVGERRQGDVESVYADNSLAIKKLDWEPTRSLEEMISSAWKWQQSISS